MKSLSLNLLRYLCGALLLTGSFQLSAEETTSETMDSILNEEQVDEGLRYLPAGKDSSPAAFVEYLNVQTRRASEDAVGVEQAQSEKDPLLAEAEAEMALEDGDQSGNAGNDAVKSIMGAVGSIGGMSTYGTAFYTTHPGAVHFLIQPGLLVGGTIQLEDFSVWAVNPNDSYKVFNWLTSDQLIVRPNSWWCSASYPFIIENVETGSTIEVSLFTYLNPVYHTVYNHVITGYDDYQRMFWLEDGTAWSVDSWDYSTNWKIGHTVIIGINTGFGSSVNPNILINANLSPQYIRCRCVN